MEEMYDCKKNVHTSRLNDREYHITGELQADFMQYLYQEERSSGTIEKYKRDLRCFLNYLENGRSFTKDLLVTYKQYLGEHFAITTANSMMAVLNGLFVFAGWNECRLKPFKRQRSIFRDSGKELTKQDYGKLLRAARKLGFIRTFYLMETLSNTGIRVSELSYITVEGITRGEVMVRCKGKQRKVLLPKRLCTELKGYCRKQGILTGPVFITRTGRPLSRAHIWADLKRLGIYSGVEGKKVFPHNFRHLFAVCFYKIEKDIAKLADLLGHATLETTRIYIMESAEKHIQQVERMGLYYSFHP